MNIDNIEIPETVPSKSKEILKKMLELLPVSAIPSLIQEINEFVSMVKTTPQKSEFLEISLIERIATSLISLLESYSKLSEEHRALTIAGVRYFITSKDANDDLQDPFGFDDDLAVINAIFWAVNRNDLVIKRLIPNFPRT